METGHGKGAPDGVGGVLKRTADQIVARGSDIPDLETLMEQLKKNVKGVIIEEVEEGGILEKDMLIPSNLPDFPGTMKVHQVVWDKTWSHNLAMRGLSCAIDDCATSSVECTHEKHLGFYNYSDSGTDKLQKRVTNKKTLAHRKHSTVKILRNTIIIPQLRPPIITKPLPDAVVMPDAEVSKKNRT